MNTLIILEPEHNMVHKYTCDEEAIIDNQKIKELGFNPEVCKWMVFPEDEYDTFDHRGIVTATKEENFERHYLKKIDVLGYYIKINGKIFEGVSGRRMWKSKASAMRMLNYCLDKEGIENKEDFKVEVIPIEFDWL